MLRFVISSSLFCATAIILLPFAACRSGSGTAKQAEIDPAGAGKAAIEQYDKNGDGVISGAELDAAPALKAALSRLDTNGDKGVSADEIAARIQAWKDMRTGLTMVRPRVMIDGQPASGVLVTFEPEAFLGTSIKKATGVSDQSGEAGVWVAKEDLPDPKLPSGVYFGLYKVRFSRQQNGKETLPARYNTETTVGQEVSYDDPGVANRNIVYQLKTGS